MNTANNASSNNNNCLDIENEIPDKDKMVTLKYEVEKSRLQDELMKLENGTHPILSIGLKKLDEQYERRKLEREINRANELELIEKEFSKEEAAAKEEFERKRLELSEGLIRELAEQQKHLESEKSSSTPKLLCSKNSIPTLDNAPVTRVFRRRRTDKRDCPLTTSLLKPNINMRLSPDDILKDLSEIKLDEQEQTKQSSGSDSDSITTSSLSP